MKPISNYSPNEIKSIQQVLKSRGQDIGASGLNKDGIDGIMGPKTIAGLRTIAESNPVINEKYEHLWGGNKSVAKQVVNPTVNDVTELQLYLKSGGYDIGSTGVDGKFGKRTDAALRQAIIKDPSIASKYGKFIPDYKPEIARPAGVGEMNTAGRDATYQRPAVAPSILKTAKKTPLQMAAEFLPPQSAPNLGILKQDRSEERKAFDKEANSSSSARSTVRNFMARNLPGPVAKGAALLAADAMGNEETMHNKVRYGIAPTWNSNNDQGAKVKILLPPKKTSI